MTELYNIVYPHVELQYMFVCKIQNDTFLYLYIPNAITSTQAGSSFHISVASFLVQYT